MLRHSLPVTVAAVAALFAVPIAVAGITTTGDVHPDPATSTTSTMLYIGDTGSGSVTIDGGSDVVSSFSYLGYAAGSDGSVTISGPGSTYKPSESLFIGYEGEGTLNILDQALVKPKKTFSIGNAQGSTGHVIVDGSGSSLSAGASLYVGNVGYGTLSVQNGADVQVATVYVGRSTNGGGGSAIVDGSGSTLIGNNDLYVGFNCAGDLTISNGGYVKGGWTIVGDGEGSGVIHFDSGVLEAYTLLASTSQLQGEGIINTNGLVSDIDLTFDATHGLQQQFTLDSEPDQNITINMDLTATSVIGVGYLDEATLTVADGVILDTYAAYLGRHAGSLGTAVMTGPGSTWNVGRLAVGEYGAAELTVEQGASLSVGSTFYMAEHAGSSGSVTVTGNGSSLDATHMEIGQIGTATLALEDGATATMDEVTLAWGGAGLATVTDTGSSWTVGNLSIGRVNTGTLNIENGGTLNTNVTHIAKSSYGSGIVTVTGPGSTWNSTSDLYVGYEGQGTLNIENGGTVVTNPTHVGENASGSGAITVNGPGSTWNSTGDLYLGYKGQGTLNIENGATVTTNVTHVGENASGSGIIAVTDPGSTWITTGDLYLGYEGQGTLNIENGGEVYSNHAFVAYGDNGVDAVGTAIVTGPDSLWELDGWLYVGGWLELDNNSTGTIHINQGGSINANTSIIGFGGTASAYIANENSRWDNEYYLNVGLGSQGSVHISDGATVTAGAASFLGSGLNGNATVTVTGAGSTFDTRLLTIGQQASATFTVSDGGLLSAATIALGADDGVDQTTRQHYRASGQLVVTEAGSRVSSSGIFIGEFADGAVTVEHGAAVDTTSTWIGINIGGVGTLTVKDAGSVWNSDMVYVGGNRDQARGQGAIHIQSQAELNVTGTLRVWNDGAVNLSGGTLTVDTIMNVAGGMFNFTGGSLHVNTFNGNLVNQGGTVLPGTSPGTTTINGNYDQQAGTLEIELDGTTAGQFDQLIVTGTASLADTLNLLPGFMPVYGDSFTILTASTISGTFDTVTGVMVNNDLALAVTYSQIAVTVTAALPGDVNFDGVVNLADLQVLGDNWQSNGATWSEADFTGDGVVNLADLQVLGDHWQSTAGDFAVLSANIPEPQALVVLSVLVGGAMIGRRRAVAA